MDEQVVGQSSLKVLIVDDTIFFRTILNDVLSQIPGVQVVGSAANGKIATHRIRTLNPDLLTLDLKMPEMDGIELLHWLGQNAPDVGAIVVSNYVEEGSDLTVKALQLGAFDYIQKVASGNMEQNKSAIRNAILPMLQSYAKRRTIRNRFRGSILAKDTEMTSDNGNLGGLKALKQRSSIVAIGVSTGGPMALKQLLPRFPANFPVPILVVQHMPAAFTHSIVSSLDSNCALRVKAGQDNEIVKPGTIYVAPGGRQMKITKGQNGQTLIRITDDRPENNCKPSADYLFRSIAHQFGHQATGVIMTGMGSDGTLGLKLMKRNGAVIIAQDEATSTVFGMPKSVIDTGIADAVVPLEDLADAICRTVGIGLSGS